MNAYRIFELKDGKLKTLFHGVDGSRVIERGRWYKAKTSIVTDGGQPYRAGFHVFRTRAICRSYLRRFTADRQLVVRRVEVEDTWAKKTNPDVVLARWMFVPTKGRK